MSETIHDLPGAVFDAHRNELSLDEKVGEDDSVKFRLGGRLTGSGYLGALSGDFLNGSRREEKAFIAFKVDPEPCVEIWVQESASAYEDDTMRRVARFSQRGNELGVGAGQPLRNELVSPAGRYRAVMQEDGNFVVYDTDPDSDPATPWWSALWSWFTGRL